jgi:hypothetical protein
VQPGQSFGFAPERLAPRPHATEVVSTWPGATERGGQTGLCCQSLRTVTRRFAALLYIQRPRVSVDGHPVSEEENVSFSVAERGRYFVLRSEHRPSLTGRVDISVNLII